MSTTVLVTIEAMTCGGCSCIFGMEETMKKNLVEQHGTFWCPRGCERHFVGETAKERAEKAANRAQELLEQSRRRNDELCAEKAATERQLSAAKGRVTRIKNRVAAGVCPCCNRTFQNLANHMKGQHPDFTHTPETP